MKNPNSKLFFELIQVAIGNRSALSSVPTQQEWQRLYGLMSKHTLIGIGYVAIQKLPWEQWPPKMFVLKWTSVANGIMNRNMALNEECKSICNEFTHDGVESIVIKGQSNLEYYPEALRNYRMPGDIDLWCQACNGVEIGEMVNGEVVKSDYHGINGVIEYCKQYERCRGRNIPWHRVLYYHCELKSDKEVCPTRSICHAYTLIIYVSRMRRRDGSCLRRLCGAVTSDNMTLVMLHLKTDMAKHGLWKLERVMRLVGSYPEESLWEPVFRGYHLIWRILHR